MTASCTFLGDGTPSKGRACDDLDGELPHVPQGSGVQGGGWALNATTSVAAMGWMLVDGMRPTKGRG